MRNSHNSRNLVQVVRFCSTWTSLAMLLLYYYYFQEFLNIAQLARFAQVSESCAILRKSMILLILEALFEHSAAHNSRNYIILYLEGYVEHSADHTLRASCVILRNLHNSSNDFIISKRNF